LPAIINNNHCGNPKTTNNKRRKYNRKPIPEGRISQNYKKGDLITDYRELLSCEYDGMIYIENMGLKHKGFIQSMQFRLIAKYLMQKKYIGLIKLRHNEHALFIFSCRKLFNINLLKL